MVFHLSQEKAVMINTQQLQNYVVPHNKGKLIGQKSPLKLKEIWSIRIRLQLLNQTRELALFNLAIDSKLRGHDLVRLRVKDITHGNQVASRAIVIQHKTHRPVQFEITEQAQISTLAWITQNRLKAEQYLFPSRIHASPHIFNQAVCTYRRLMD